MKKSIMADKSKKRIYLIVLSIIGILLIIGGYLSYQAYQAYLARKIYTPNETVSTSDFDLKITKHETTAIELPLDNEFVKKYAGIANNENCDAFSKAPTVFYAGGIRFTNGPSDSDICIRRNNSRDAIKKYEKENRRIVVDYEIAAKKNVDTSKLKVELIVDSGRKLNSRVSELEWNQFFPLIGDEKMLLRNDEQYISSSKPYDYIPYSISNTGEDINSGITRLGSASTDVRKSEKTIDFKISYSSGGVSYSRIVRIAI